MCGHIKPQRPFKRWLRDWHISKCAEQCIKKVDISKDWVLGYKNLLVGLYLVTFTDRCRNRHNKNSIMDIQWPEQHF